MNETKEKLDISKTLTIIFGFIVIGIGIYIIISRTIPQPWNYGHDAYLRGIFLLITGFLLLLLSKSIKGFTRDHIPTSYTHFLTGISVLFGLILVLSEIFLELSVGNDWGHFQFLCLYPIQAFFVLLSLIHLFNLRKQNLIQSFLPVIINLIFILVFNISAKYVPETNLGFRWKLDDYEEVISLVNNNSIQLDSNGIGELPDEYKYLSDGGRIWVAERGDVLDVMFLEHRGILGEYRGTVFSPDGSPPIDHNNFTCDILEQIQKDNPNWYECTST